ncbi:MAG: ubiquinone/menaquinone biosynthesis methyltransferase [Candidatus Omnitrophica bacterium]|nr:ubiquinone/menaquinone biosynthesis methyltransferase [Candidatus Omnitrophota bacterium]
MSLIEAMIPPASAPSELKATEIQNFFNAIAPRYDLLNSLLSLRLDDYWRAKSRDLLLEGAGSAILDLGTGTGKFLELFLSRKKWKTAVGLDFSRPMLKQTSSLEDGRTNSVKIIQGDFHSLPFCSESFDLIVSAFTLRSVRHMVPFLEGVYRLLKEGGRAGFLCLTRPVNPIAKLFFYPYLKWVLPWLGGLVSGNRDAYLFLRDSILEFQAPTQTVEIMRRTGFQSVRVYRFSFGIATLLVGRK